MLFLRRKPQVVFVYSKRYEQTGSTIMRGFQLSQLFSRQYSKHFSVTYRPFSMNFRNSTLFLTKGAYLDISVEQIKQLQMQNNIVLLDIVDSPVHANKAKAANLVVAASHEAHKTYTQQGLRTYLINHHVDPRITFNNSPPDYLKTGYFGEMVNTIATKAIAEKVDFHQVDTGRQNTSWFDLPAQYNLHYAVRADNVEAHKPFLKGFIAAACGANIIIQKDQKEAVHWLGKDYPFLLPARPKEPQILDMLDYVQKSYGGPAWKHGLKAMDSIKTQTSSSSITHEFYTMLQLLNS